MLFTPGTRIDMVEKAIRSGTYAVIVDPEDAVSADNKELARGNLRELPQSAGPYYRRANAVETGMLWDHVVAAGDAEVVGLIIQCLPDKEAVGGQA